MKGESEPFSPLLAKVIQRVAAKLTWLRAARCSPLPSAAPLSHRSALNRLKHTAPVKSLALFAAAHTTGLWKVNLSVGFYSIHTDFEMNHGFIEPLSTDNRPSSFLHIDGTDFTL